jgi:hypothetical protein
MVVVVVAAVAAAAAAEAVYPLLFPKLALWLLYLCFCL